MDYREFAVELGAWLSTYTDDVINHVMSQIEDIKNNEFARTLIHELYVRSEKERKSFIDGVYIALISADGGNRAFHLNVLTHSNSYRDVLHDMYIMK